MSSAWFACPVRWRRRGRLRRSHAGHHASFVASGQVAGLRGQLPVRRGMPLPPPLAQPGLRAITTSV
ncbi:MAG: hypothetical protein ABR926_23660, partial [Streptosporangiaceae bacterium]